MKRPPLLIISCSRSGSSMVAGIFARHGWWVGTCRPPDRFNAKGYYENLPVKHCMKRYFGDNIHEANKGKVYDIKREKASGFKRMVERVIRNDGYADDGGPWLVKFGALYWRPWRRCFPACTTLCLFRDAGAIKASGRRSFKVTQERIDAQRGIMMEAEEDSGAFHVDYEQLIRGNYSQLVPVFAKEGVEMKIACIRSFIDPSLCHFGERT